MTEWAELTTRGHLVIPSFLTTGDVEVLRADFQSGACPSEYDLGYKPIGDEVLAAFEPRICELLESVRASTGLRVDTILNGFYFATRFAKKTDNYHQDYDAYYRQSRDHINYLNFYTPITKPNRDQSNLCLVPFDVLQERAPAVHDHLKGGGANFVHQRRKRLIVENADTRSRTYFDVDFQLEDLATAPLLSEGDLLIFRGDVLHKSQDLESTRVAASIRAGSSEYGYRRHTELRWFREGRKSSGEPPR